MILAGDIGATNARLALFEPGELRVASRAAVLASSAFEAVEDMLEEFVGADRAHLAGACLGIAGPIRGGQAAVTNRGWLVERQSVAARLDLEGVELINDLHATAVGLESLEPSDLQTLNEGERDPAGTVAVVAAGTGMGQAGLVRVGQRAIPFATESGHASFAPTTDEQMRLLAYLRGLLAEPVSVELVCSGPGITNIFRWCLHESNRSDPSWFGEAACQGDQAAAITAAAAARADDDAARAMRVFVEIYGAEAGNAALHMLATGGVYIAGGIAAKLSGLLREGAFMASFLQKSRLADLLRLVPVHVVLNDQVALLGAARQAALALDPDEKVGAAT